MNVLIEGFDFSGKAPVLRISGSKSISNRWLILQQFFPEIELVGLSDSDDTKALLNALATTEGTVDIGHAGTAMRFLTAYYAVTPGVNVVLTGSSRMTQRPIGPLVEALRTLGADIQYMENRGFPPLKIIGQRIDRSETSIDASISSQFITALMLVAPKLDNGLNIYLKKQLVSESYLKLTSRVLEQCGVKLERRPTLITVDQKKGSTKQSVQVESDWSSAGYWFSVVALSPVGFMIRLKSYDGNSAQGDRALVEIFENFGVRSEFVQNELRLTKVSDDLPDTLKLDLRNQPDQAQTVFCTAIGLGVDLELQGLHTLGVKETDRLKAMQVEGLRFRESVKNIHITADFLKLQCHQPVAEKEVVTIKTYQDHRMAMAFAALGVRTKVEIQDVEVVEKSYPQFWDDFRQTGGQIKSLNT